MEQAVSMIIKTAPCSCGKEWKFFEGHDKVGIPKEKWYEKIHSCADLDVYRWKITMYYNRKKLSTVLPLDIERKKE